MGVSVPAIGMVWFLIVLFLGRSLFDYLHLKLGHKQFVIAILICTSLGVAFGKFQWLPFSFDCALAVMPFFYFDSYSKPTDYQEKQVLFWKRFFYYLGWNIDNVLHNRAWVYVSM